MRQYADDLFYPAAARGGALFTQPAKLHELASPVPAGPPNNNAMAVDGVECTFGYCFCTSPKGIDPKVLLGIVVRASIFSG